MPAACRAVRTGDQVGRLGDDLEGLAEVVDLLGAGVEHGASRTSSSETVLAWSDGTITTPLRLNR